MNAQEFYQDLSEISCEFWDYLSRLDFDLDTETDTLKTILVDLEHTEFALRKWLGEIDLLLDLFVAEQGSQEFKSLREQAVLFSSYLNEAWHLWPSLKERTRTAKEKKKVGPGYMQLLVFCAPLRTPEKSSPLDKLELLKKKAFHLNQSILNQSILNQSGDWVIGS